MNLLSLTLGLLIAGSSLVFIEPRPQGDEGKGDDKYDCLTPCRIDDPDCVCGPGKDEEPEKK
jgi:hypothetical protein